VRAAAWLLLTSCAQSSFIDTRPADLTHEAAPTPPPAAEFTEVPARIRARFAALMARTYCYCGCTESVSVCLASDACACRNCARRVADHATRLANEGVALERIEARLDSASAAFHAPPFDFDVDPPAAVQGPDDAAISITEFADFGCPHCARLFPQLESFAAERGDIQVSFRPYPLRLDPETLEPMEAAEVARRAGRFWPFAHALFEAGGRMVRSELLELAAGQGLSVSELEPVLEARSFRSTVLAHRRLGRQAGIRGTPAVFVQGRPLGLPPTLDNLALRVEMERRRGVCN
jgi:protein-disulfide isomerase